MPNDLKHRDDEIKAIIDCLWPLFYNRKSDNLIIYGDNGVGKTTVMNKICNDIWESDEISVIPIMIDCKKYSSEYGIYNLIYNELFNKSIKKGSNISTFIRKISEKLKEEGKSLLLVLDDVHYLSDDIKKENILVNILKKFGRTEETYEFYCSIALISNKKININLDNEGRSVFKPKEIYFKKYTRSQLSDIVMERIRQIFHKDIITGDVFERIIDEVEKDNSDLRTAWNILRTLFSKMEDENRMPDMEMLESVLDQTYPLIESSE